MAITLNNLSTLSILNILSRTTIGQQNIMTQMSTGSRINRGADDPAGLVALTMLDGELTAIKAGISNNQRTDAMLGVADNALSEIGTLVDEIQRLANETANDAALTAEEITANQAQIDDALASIDRIVGATNFNGKKLLDGSLGINYSNADTTKITDVKVFSRKAGGDDATLTIELTSASDYAVASQVAISGSIGTITSFAVQGQLGTAVIEVASNSTLSAIAAKVNAAAATTGVSATVGAIGSGLVLYSRDKGDDAFVRTSYISGDTSLANTNAIGVDAEIAVNGMKTATDGDSVSFSGNGVSVSFEVGSLGTGSTTTLTIKGSTSGRSGATFNLGTNGTTLATVGLDGVYTHNLGTATIGYLASLGSGKGNSLLDDPSQAATIAREAAGQVARLQGRIGGFQKFQVRTAVNSLNDQRQGLESARSVINDVDYATASSDLNRANILMQSAMGLLGLANQQSGQVLALLRG